MKIWNIDNTATVKILNLDESSINYPVFLKPH